MKKRGFTLVELLAGLAFFGVIIMTCMPNFFDLFKNQRKTVFSNQIALIQNKITESFSSSSSEEKPLIYSSVGFYSLNSNNIDVDYYAELNADGSIKYLEITDGEFYYQSDESLLGSDNFIDLKEDNKISSKINFIKNNVADEKIIIHKDTYELYDHTNSIPVIISNFSGSTLNIDVYYGNYKISEFVVKSGISDYMHFVKLTNSMINSMEFDKVYNLKLDVSVNLGKNLSDDKDVIISNSYNDYIKLKRVNSDIIIKSVDCSMNGDKLGFNQSGIYISNGVNIGNLNIIFNNKSDSKNYKFTNINRYKLNDLNEFNKLSLKNMELLKYQAYLKDGKYINSKKNFSYTMKLSSENYIQKIDFDFDEYINPGIYHNGNVFMISKDNFDDNKFGDFSNSKSYSLEFNQSMSIQDNYSVYMSVNGSVYQKSNSYPVVIFSLGDKSNYISLIGLYDGYLHVYSYYAGTLKKGTQIDRVENGFVSIPVSEYDGKVMNIQVTGSKLNKTKVFINGKLIVEFDSGKNSVTSKMGCIGDLVTSSGFNYNGIMYDFALYNSELVKSAVDYNWKYAQKTWNIN